MTHEFVAVLSRGTLVASAAVLVVLALRPFVCRMFGAQATYRLWLLVPLAIMATLLPAPAQPIARAFEIIAFGAADVSVAVAPTSETIDFPSLVFDAWIIGALITFILFVLQQRRYLRNLGQLTGIDAHTVRAERNDNCPALVGALLPRIVLPGDFESRYAPHERELVLAHERAHLARGDAQINALVAALRCLQWFNPLFHVTAARFRFDQELACDAAVIARFPEARRCYADAMLKTQLAGEARQELRLPVGCHWPSSHPLKERIAMLKQPLPGRARTALGSGLAAALIVAGSYAAWAAQPVAASTANAPSGAHATYRKLSRIVYPAAALTAKHEGVVYVDVHVAADGRVAGADAERSDPLVAKELAEAAVSGVSSWSFNPAQKDGKAAPSDEIVPVVFALDPGNAAKATHGTLDAIRVAPPAEPPAAAQDSAPREITAGRKLHPPQYPLAALKAKQSGKIVLKVLVDERGNPTSATVFKAEPPEAEVAFATASIDAAMQWKFDPLIENGVAKPGAVLVPVTYSLTDK